ncbi:hypothetical protein ACFWIB_14470 [Streptomyces sp. NPDC127051]|uniref:hypothetical protein n=1 Tax=Streptomyces sp. NPDC127051 TaxID=3347119 RepID=UPI0036602CAF
MTAWEAVGACIAVAILLLAAATKGWDRWHKPRTTRRFQRTARKAARADGELTADERHVFAQIIAAEYPAQIPHQTRRTEENQ